MRVAILGRVSVELVEVLFNRIARAILILGNIFLLIK